MGCRELYAMPPANICWQPFCPHILSHRPWSSWNQSSLGFHRLPFTCLGSPGHWELLGVLGLIHCHTHNHPAACPSKQTQPGQATCSIEDGPASDLLGHSVYPPSCPHGLLRGSVTKKICEEGEVSASWHSLPKSCLGQVPPLLYFITACVVSFMFDFVSLSPTKLWVQEGSLLISR